MKPNVAVAGILLACLSSAASATQQDSFSGLTGPYLGQEPPGMVPEVFAPGLISTGADEGCSGFLHDANVFVFRRPATGPVRRDIFVTILANGRWTQPEPAPFDSKYGDGDFTVAADGKTLYFTSSRPVNASNDDPVPSNIWVTRMDEREWSEPQLLESPVNLVEHGESYPAVTRDGTIYFFSRRPGGLGEADIYRSRLTNGQYTEVDNLGPVINTDYEEWDPFIAPDESYLIFCSTKPGGYGRDDLYVSFRRHDGTWTVPLNLGESVNSHTMDNRPYVTPDGEYFFYVSGRDGNRDVFWVDTEFLERLRP